MLMSKAGTLSWARILGYRREEENNQLCGGKPKKIQSTTTTSASSHVHRVILSFLPILSWTTDHTRLIVQHSQAQRQIKKKIKEKENKASMKRFIFFFSSSQKYLTIFSHTKKNSHRLLLQNQVEEQTVKDDATLNVIKLDFMSPSSTVHPMTIHHLSSLP